MLDASGEKLRATYQQGLDTQVDLLEIPDYLRNYLNERKISTLFPIQKLSLDAGIINGRSLLISAPSGSGKTLVSEFAILRTLYSSQGKVLYLVPLRAIASEKASDFRKYFPTPPEEIIAVFGDNEVSNSDLQRARVVIATYEKFDSYLRNPKQNFWINELHVVIIDEIHNINDKNRGPRLESVIIRLCRSYPKLQVVGLTGTIANPDELALWLSSLRKHGDCQLIHSDYRPVELRYKFKVTQDKTRELQKLVNKGVKQDGQLLVFCRSRKDAELTAKVLASGTSIFLTASERLELSRVSQTLWNYQTFAREKCDVLNTGIGFHHAGLSNQEREVITDLYNTGLLKVLCCTTTLESGINTPSDIVVIKNMFQYHKIENGFSRNPLELHQFHQICGRAGRPGFQQTGIALIFFDNYDEQEWVLENYFEDVHQRIKPRYSRITSQIFDPSAFIDQVLTNIDDDGTCDMDTVNHFFKNTFRSTFFTETEQIIPFSAPYSTRSMKQFLKSLERDLTDLKKDPEFDIQELERTSDFVDFFVREREGGEIYYCGVNVVEGLSCNCKHFEIEHLKRALFESSPILKNILTIFKKDLLCPHLIAVIRVLMEKKYFESFTSIFKNYLRRISAFHFLQINGFIEINGKTRVRKTPLGIITSKYYLRPPDILDLIKSLELKENSEPTSLLDLAIKHFHLVGPKISQEKMETLFHRINQESANWGSPQDYSIYPGDLEKVLEKIGRFAGLISDLASLYGVGRLQSESKEFAENLSHFLTLEA